MRGRPYDLTSRSSELRAPKLFISVFFFKLPIVLFLELMKKETLFSHPFYGNKDVVLLDRFYTRFLL